MNFLKKLDFIENEETNQSLLDELADSENILIVESVAKNVNVLGTTLDKLSKSKSIQVLLNVVNNPNTDVNTIENMYGIKQHNWVNNAIQKRLKDSHFFDSVAWNRGDYENSIVKIKKETA